ncbi:MAG: HlyD family efflux transporter periplasmic adaptor subunit [Sedimentisphaerales bacterium]|nr:HlyD family efflux transporter periplasmic adaptor subunit [Sedimentisphaerales bacterium]
MATDMQVNSFQERLKQLDQEIEDLSRSEVETVRFFRLFLERTVSVLGAGGAIWQYDPSGSLVPECHINLKLAGLEEGGSQFALLASALQKVVQTKNPVVLPAHAGSNVYDGGLGEAGLNESAHTLLFVPILRSQKLGAVLLLIAPTDVDPRAVAGYLGFVIGLCDRAGAFLQHKYVTLLEEQLAKEARIRECYSSLHNSLDPRRSAYALANFGQELLGVYRCMAGTYDPRGKFRILSVSGLESVAVKSSFLREISQIAKQVCINDKPLLVENPEAARAAARSERARSGADQSETDQSETARAAAVGQDDLVTAARLYMLQAKSLILGVFPIRREDRVVGAFVVEKAKEIPIDAQERYQIEAFLAEAGRAFANALQYRRLPLSPLMRAAGALRDRIYRWSWARRLIWGGLIAALLATPAVVDKQVKVIGNAELAPVEARLAYAGEDGMIEWVDIPQDRRVKAGQVLASLDTKIIEQQIDKVRNSIAETSFALDEETSKSGRSARVLMLESKKKALEAEWRRYELEKQQFQITAPIDGTVITRESVLRMLPSRPVRRGEAILEVIPDDTEWELMVFVPEDEAGQLLEAYKNLPAGQTLNAKVILKAYPDTIFDSTVTSIAQRAHVQSSGEQKYRNVIEVRVRQPQDLRRAIDPRQGLQGKVAIECGRRSLYYAMTNDFINFLRISLF